MTNKKGFSVKRRKFLTISVSAGIGLAIPSLIDSYEDNQAEAANAVSGVIVSLATSLPVLAYICQVAEPILKQKLEEVKNYYGIRVSNNRNSIIAIEKNLLKNKTNIANTPPFQTWNQRQAEVYINGLFGQKVNQSASPNLKLWALNEHYKVGEKIAFQDKKYKCRQSHTVYADNWTPPNTPALWESIPIK